MVINYCQNLHMCHQHFQRQSDRSIQKLTARLFEQKKMFRLMIEEKKHS